MVMPRATLSVTMPREVKLNRLESVLDELDYPIDAPSAAATFDDVSVQLSEGSVNLGSTIAESSADSFETIDDLASEVRSRLPRHAVGEPYQSEGEG